MPEGFFSDVTVHAWGGGGGGGGISYTGEYVGGNGGGGGYIAKTLTVESGDVLEIAVGGGGGSGAQGVTGGSGGESLKLPQYSYIVGGSAPLSFDILTIGGGGGGGGGSSRPFPWTGAGGGAGDIRYSSVTFNPGDRIGIDVAAGGAAGAARDGPFSGGAPGTAGGTSQVRRDASIVSSAPGGGGGQQAQVVAPIVGAAGSGGTGTQVLTPTAGTNVQNDSSSGIGPGGTGGKGYLVPTDASGTYSYGNTGAGGIGQTNTPGQTGTVCGGGGGGGGSNGANNLNGMTPAAGGTGLVVISYTTTDGVPVFSGGTITIVGLRVTHTFSVGTAAAYNGGSGGGSVAGGDGSGGGGGGATVVLLNGVIVGYACGGGGGAGGGGYGGVLATTYTGSTASNPWRQGIVAGTSGYYVRNVGVSGGSNYIIGYEVVADGTVLYRADTPTAGAYVAPPDPAKIAKTTLVGYSYFVTIPQPNTNPWGLPTDQDLYELVECFSFVLYEGIQGQNAPGPNGQDIYSSAGSNGQSGTVGGGGGGGAGGNGGGAGTQFDGTIAQAGAYGRLFGDVTQLPSGTQPGGTNTPYFAGRPGYGGGGQSTFNSRGTPGTSGYAVVEMESKSLHIKDSGSWKPVNNTFIKHNNTWQQTKAIFVNQNGIWTPVKGTSDAYAPNFGARIGYFGSIPRPYGT